MSDFVCILAASPMSFLLAFLLQVHRGSCWYPLVPFSPSFTVKHGSLRPTHSVTAQQQPKHLQGKLELMKSV